MLPLGVFADRCFTKANAGRCGKPLPKVQRSGLKRSVLFFFVGGGGEVFFWGGRGVLGGSIFVRGSQFVFFFGRIFAECFPPELVV